GDICSGAGDEAQMLDFGEEDSHDVFDLRNSRNIILWGKNPVISSPHLVPVLKEASAAKLLIDPVWHKSARLCEEFVQPRPGGDFSLAMAVARVLFERGWTEPGFEKYCDNDDRFRALAFAHGVAGWCEDADVSPAAAEDIARRLHEGPAAILVGWGMARRVNGGAIVRALDALCARASSAAWSTPGPRAARGRRRWCSRPRRCSRLTTWSAPTVTTGLEPLVPWCRRLPA